MKCRKRKSVGGLQAGAAITSSIGNGALAIAPFTGPAAPFVAAGGAILDVIGAGLNLGATKEQNKIDNRNGLRTIAQQDYNTYAQTPDVYDDYIPTINNFKLGGDRYYNRFQNTNIKAKRR